MKKLCLVTLLALSTNVFAHSQSPHAFGGKDNLPEAISLSDNKMVPFYISNINTTPVAYTVFVDGVEVHKTKVLHQGAKERVDVYLSTKIKNKPVSYKVCSRANVEEGLRTMVCSTVQLVRL